MKNVKKLLSILMVLTLVLSLGATAFAAEGANVSIEEPAKGHTYVAYQIFTGNQAAKEDDSAIGNLAWGDGINAEGLVEALKTDATLGTSFKDIDGTAKSVAEVLGTFNDNSDMLKAFAKLAKGFVVTGAGKTVTDGGTLPIGYYLIEDTTDVADKDAVKNEVILQVTRDVTVAFKTEKPEVTKKVQDRDDTAGSQTGWQESADWDIGDEVPFQLGGTFPADYDIYNAYKMVFHDTQSAGLTFLPASVEVFWATKNADGSYTKGNAITNAESNYYSVAWHPDGTFEVTFDDIKTIPGHVDGNNAIVIEYKSVLNENAVIGIAGNPNEVYLEFSNDSTSNGTGKTPEKTVIVFTFDLTVNKVEPDGTNGDGTEKYKSLEGAQFNLYKEVPAKTAGATPLKPDGTGYKEGEDIPTDAKYYIDLGAMEMQADKVTFYSKGLDDGNYMIVETVTPDGYNTAAPVTFTIEANHVTTSSAAMTEEQLVIKDGASKDVDSSGAVTNVVNRTGLELPETGGIGTTIFYVAGAVLVAAAVILLVTRKRMSGTEK